MNAGTTEAPAITLREFFETQPPGSIVTVDANLQEDPRVVGVLAVWPDIILHCEQDVCSGPRMFTAVTGSSQQKLNTTENKFVSYRCRNCQISSKTFALKLTVGKETALPVRMFKFGELPPFGPPTPARLTSLVGSERDFYLKGRRAESQSMGIAAFAYYRRVVENKKVEIFDQIIRVSRLLSADAALLEELEQAKAETQFTRAVEMVKHGIPQILLINGHNPLTLLHSALSEGLHAQSDQQCLELAHSIRVVLTEFVERVATAMKDEQELAGAVSRLMQVKGRAPAPK